MGEERMSAPPAVGGSSLLVMFAVLCLTVFALLSLTTVRASGRLSQASADAVSAYYAADLQAESILAQIRAGETPEGVTVNGDTYLYSCPISDTQTLRVEVRVTGETAAVLRWQAVPAGEWTPDAGLPVWTGE